jgi:hypothetical protein
MPSSPTIGRRSSRNVTYMPCPRIALITPPAPSPGCRAHQEEEVHFPAVLEEVCRLPQRHRVGLALPAVECHPF